MTRVKVRSLACVVAFAVSAAGARQQSSADALVAKARTALGVTALDSVKTLSIGGTVSLNFGGTIPTTLRTVEIDYVSPSRYLRALRQRPIWPVAVELVYYDGFNGSDPIRDLVTSLHLFPVFFDGSGALENQQAYRARRLEERRDDFVQTMLPLFVVLPNDFGLTFEAGGRATYDGRAAQAIAVSGHDRGRWELWIEEKSGLPIRLSWTGRPVAAKIQTSLGPPELIGGAPTTPPSIVFPVDPATQAPDVEWVTTIREYGLTNGLNWPRRFVTTVGGKPYADFRVGRYQINPDIDPAVFRRAFR
jgi:hypothetical protein